MHSSYVHRPSTDPAGSIYWPPYSKKCLVISLVHRVILSFRQWSIVPFVFSSNINRSSIQIQDSPLMILNNSIKCLFLLSSRVHNPKYPNLSSYDVVSVFLIICVNLCWMISINSLSFCPYYLIISFYHGMEYKVTSYSTILVQKSCITNTVINWLIESIVIKS